MRTVRLLPSRRTRFSNNWGYEENIFNVVIIQQFNHMTTAPQGHEPVLLHEVLEGLNVFVKGRYLDGTFGGGGHTRAILQANPENEVWALDRDPAAIERSVQLKEEFGERFHFVSANFSEMGEVAPGPWNGILLDLGVSSFQLDQAERGFSFREAGPLDMRMNPEAGLSAQEWLMQVTGPELVKVLRQYGEEPFARPITRAILEARDAGMLNTTADLARVVESAIPAKRRFQKSIHPATLTFQAIRIAVNEELLELEQVLDRAFANLAPQGRLAIISFHSLEDRMVKRFYRRMAGQPETRWDSTPMDFRKVLARQITSRPIEATAEEMARNPRSRSARLRILEKLHISQS